MKVFVAISLSLLAVAGVTAAFSLTSGARSSDATQPDAMKTPAPEFLKGKWINAGEGISLASRKGKVTVVEFWTFACSNCQANLPAYAKWQNRFGSKGLVVIGVHTPETDYEKVPANVMKQVGRLGITYPVLIDEDYQNWNKWGVNAWPTLFIVDKKGSVRYRWVGELNYRNSGGEEKLTGLIEKLLDE